MKTFIEGDRIMVRNDAVKIRRDIRNTFGTIIKWTFENYYLVKTDNKCESGSDEFLLSGNEITKI